MRGWPDDALTTLLVARPDLTTPAPQDSAQLASRAGTRASVLRALDQLTRLELTVLDAVVALGGRCPSADLARHVAAPADRVADAVEHLRNLVLLWGTPEDLRVVSAVTDTLGTSVSGLGPPLDQLTSGYGPERVARLLTDLGEGSTGDRARDLSRIGTLLSDPETVAAQVAACDEAARAMLEHLDRTGAEGASEHARAPVDVASARTPVEHLVARGLLLPRDSRHLVVPREVGIALRGGHTTREPVGEAPPLATSARAPRLVDQAAAGAAYELVHRVELLLDHWGAEPPGVLRQGGLAVRDLRATATLLHCDERTATLVVELCAAAGLLAEGVADEYDAAWLPTPAFDLWREQPLPTRWARLAGAWLHQPRLTGPVGGKVQGKTVNALSPDLERPWLVETRRAALAEVAALPSGEVLAAGTGLPSLVARLVWLRPRRPASRADAVAWVLEEAAVVGLLGLGGLAQHGRALLDDGEAAASSAVAALLPKPVDHVLLQADLTAVAPGPLEQSLARDLAAVALVESRGGATVYRFTEESVRHAFDLGWSATEVHDAIARASRTEVPQPLRYLVDDVARTHGTVRIGTAESFLRSDDETALATLIHDPRAAGLRLRRIAPTVAVSDMPADVLLPRLRGLGVSPVLEGADGVVALSRRDVHRARLPHERRTPHTAESTVRIAARAAATVTAIRSGDRSSAVRPSGSEASRQSPASNLALLREAVETGASVWIGYVDNDGSSHDRVVDPVRVDGGRLRAHDHRTDTERTYAVHRITSVRLLPPE